MLSEALKRFTGIITLTDLFKAGAEAKFYISKWKQILIYDTNLSKIGYHSKYRNFTYWNDRKGQKDIFYYHKTK